MDIYAPSPISSMDLYILYISSKDFKAFSFLVKALASSIVSMPPNNLGRFSISSKSLFEYFELISSKNFLRATQFLFLIISFNFFKLSSFISMFSVRA